MIQTILDRLWKSNAKVNNRLDGYWYVRLADVARVIEEEMEKDKDDRYKDQEWSQDNWNKGQRYYRNPNSIKPCRDDNDQE